MCKVELHLPAPPRWGRDGFKIPVINHGAYGALGDEGLDFLLLSMISLVRGGFAYEESELFLRGNAVTDEETLKELAAGGSRQSAALRHLYLGKGKEFGRLFVRMGLDRAAADDVLQETFLKILRQAQSYKGEGSSQNHANAWMWQIARNALADHYRHKPAEEGLDEDGWRKAEEVDPRNPAAPITLSTTDELDPSRQAEDCVQKGLALFAKKDPDRAYAIELVVEGVDGNEIAERIGRSYTATRQYLTQCRKALAPFIKHCLLLLPA